MECFFYKSLHPGLRTRLLLISVLPVLLVTLLYAIAGTQLIQFQDEQTRQLLEEDNYLMRSAQIASIVDMAESLITPLILADPEGRDPQVRAQAVALLRQLRFDDANYIWVYAPDGRLIVNAPDPSHEGKMPREWLSREGQEVIAQILHTGAEGGGQIRYRWLNPGTGEIDEKISLVRVLPHWNWHIGAGVYLDAVDQHILAALEDSQALSQRMLWWLNGLSLVLLWVVLAVTLLVVRRMLSQLHQLRTHTQTVFEQAQALLRESGCMSTRTEDQVDQIVQIAASTEQIATAITSNARHASEVQELAKANAERAHQGESTAVNANTAMSMIQSASQKMGDMISLIDEVAFQTNLLAINAAVEAARAGSQGNGFAVVASEVRNLAKRSSEAAGTIRELIAQNIQQVDTGTTLVREVNQQLGEIVEAASSVDTLNQSIALSSSEQSKGLGQVNSAMHHLEEITQKNASLTRHTNALAQTLIQSAEALTLAIRRMA